MNNSLVKWNQFESVFDRLTHDMFDAVFQDPMFAISRNFRPESWLESDSEYTFEVELPRFSLKDINIESKGGSLKITAKNNKSSYLREISLSGADFEKTKASLRDGVLSITIPKTEQSQVKQIPISE